MIYFKLQKIFKDNFLNDSINLVFIIIASFCTLIIFGFDFIKITNTGWIHHSSSDLAQSHIGWYFFKNDIWRFPFGSNPNYGSEFGNSIIFSDSIPILALFFKLLSPLMPNNFHYFSIWYFLCFLLQIYFSYKIVFYFTKSKNFSLISSLFFLIAPIFILRMSLHPALAGHWLLLFTLYLCLVKNHNDSKLNWIFLISLSCLVHWYFTVIISITFITYTLLNYLINKKNFFKIVKDFLLTFLTLLFVMYIVGYFEVRAVDGLGIGYGELKLNLLSIFDPAIAERKESWSWILPDIKMPNAEDQEGFNYLGIGQILMIAISLIFFLKNKNSQNLLKFKKNTKIKIFLYISIILTMLALSNKISFGQYTLIEIPIHKFIYASLSLMRSSGRLFWIVNYFLVILSIIIIFYSLKEKNH